MLTKSARFLITTAFFSLVTLTFSFSEKYKISEVTYELEGTREKDLERTVPLDSDKIFESKEEFEEYLSDFRQRLVNTRCFQEVKLESTEEKDEDDETIRITLSVKATDSKHLLVLPYPKYDSNDGLVLKIKVKDVNFFGTMNTMDAGIYAGLKEDELTGDQNPTFGAEFNYRLPFYMGPFFCSWNNDFEVKYTKGVDELEFWSGTGFTFELPLKRLSFVLDVNERANRDFEYEEYGDINHFTSDVNFSIPVKIFDIDGWGYVFWTPFADGKVSYDKDEIHIKNDDLASPVISAGQTLSTSRINWHGNFRSGLSAKIGHSYGYDFQQEEKEPRFFGEISAFKGFKYIGFNARLSAFRTNSNRQEIGGLIRGVRDKQKYINTESVELRTKKALKTPSAVVLNIDMPVHLISTHWLDWSDFIFGEESWISRNFSWTDKLNFEVQVSPFMDIALTKNEITGRLFSPKDGWYTGGIEILVFPENWKGIVVRASAGIDLGRAFIAKKYPERIDMSWRSDIKKYEIYAGIGLHY